MRTPRKDHVKQIIHAELSDAKSKYGVEVKAQVVVLK